MRKLKSFLRGLGLLVIVAIGVAAWIKLPWFVWLAIAVLFAAWMLATRGGRQASSVTGVGIGTLRSRIGSASVIVVGIAGVVGVLVALLALGEGYQATLKGTGSDDTAIVLRGGSSAEPMSVLSSDAVTVITQAPGIARDSQGKPIASPELVVAANLPLKRAPSEDSSVVLRGIGDEAWVLRPSIRIVSGRKFKPGLRELDVGVNAARQFAGLEPGHTVKLGNQTWTVVGVFEGGDALDSEIWADADTVAGIYRRGSSRNAVTVRLTSPAAFKQFAATLKADPRLNVDVETTLDYYAKQSATLLKIIRVVGIVVGIIMAIGALFGALNTMYAAVATRAREIATLRAVGFRGLPVVIAVLLETMLLALLGGILGGVVAWVAFNGYTASTIAGGVGSLTFHMQVSPALLWMGLKWALAIGFVGGLFPAMRAARLPVTTALREL